MIIFQFLGAIFLLIFGLMLLSIAIDVLKTPSNIHARNHDLTKKINSGDLVDSEHVDDLLSIDTRTGELVVEQQLNQKAMTGPDYGERI
jgi:hypothetical protein